MYRLSNRYVFEYSQIIFIDVIVTHRIAGAISKIRLFHVELVSLLSKTQTGSAEPNVFVHAHSRTFQFTGTWIVYFKLQIHK